MKKLEKLNQSSFKKFEDKKLNNLAKCVGGTFYDTTTSVGSGKDCVNTDTCGGCSWNNYNNIDCNPALSTSGGSGTVAPANP